MLLAHKYLGLTREILQAEDELNTLVSYPLPPAFYEQGGMRNLRERFQPELRTSPKPLRTQQTDVPDQVSSSPVSRAQTIDGKDYFTFSPGPADATKPPSLRSTTPKATLASHIANTETHESRPLPNRQDTSYGKRPSSRKLVGAGDLLSMTSVKADEDEAYYRPQARTPGFTRNDTWQAKTPGPFRGNSTLSITRRKTGKQYQEPTAESLTSEFDLKEAVMTSIAESIGLIQAPSAEPTMPSTGDSLAMSNPGSPLLFGQKGRRPTGSVSMRSPFGGLSMLDITRSNASTPGHLRGDDDASHADTVAESTTGGIADLENDVQILYYKAGSVLVKEGEANAGL